MPDQDGSFAGKVSAITVGDLFSFDHVVRSEPKIRDDGHSVWIFRCGCPYIRSKQWYGNWCWDAYWFAPGAALSFLAALRADGRFELTGGLAVACDAWNANTVTAEMLTGPEVFDA